MPATKTDPRSLREARGLRREELAAKAKVSLNTVATCEQQRRFPKQHFVRARYLAALGLAESDVTEARK